MLALVNWFGTEARRAVDAGVYLKKILALPIRERIARAKYMAEDQLKDMEALRSEVTKEIDELIDGEASSVA